MVFIDQSGRESQVGHLRLRFPPLFIYLFIYNMGISFAISLLSSFIWYSVCF